MRKRCKGHPNAHTMNARDQKNDLASHAHVPPCSNTFTWRAARKVPQLGARADLDRRADSYACRQARTWTRVQTQRPVGAQA
eukprot:15437053-Alexandrium_andersonii.AAC.1